MIEQWYEVWVDGSIYEVWVDGSIKVPYVLFLTHNPQDSSEILIIDPQEKNSIIKKMPDYETAKLWLLEDEYTLVNGRMEIDES